MSVRRKPDGRWYFRKWVRFPDGKKVRVFGTAREFGLPNTKAATAEAETRKVAAILSGQPVRVAPKPPKPKPAPKGETVSGFAPTYLQHSDAKNKSSSVDSKKQILRDHIEPRIGDLELGGVTFAVIEDLKHALLTKEPDGPGLSFKTVNNVLTVLRRLLALAVKRGLLTSIPEIEWLRPPPSEFDFLAFDEADRFMAVAAGDWYPMIMVGLRCGLRQSELLGLRWEDVDLVAGRITVRQAIVRGKITTPKNHKTREVPLGEQVGSAIRDHRHLRGRYVFCDADGNHLTKGECKHPLWGICKRAGLRRIGWHVLRHTFASHLVMRGVPLKAVQELLGHATIQMTMRYAHLSPDVTRDAVRLLDGGAQRGAQADRNRR